jgi:hypothetical protein
LGAGDAALIDILFTAFNMIKAQSNNYMTHVHVLPRVIKRAIVYDVMCQVDDITLA